jgi:hypothetical protein
METMTPPVSNIRRAARLELYGGLLVLMVGGMFYWMWKTDESGHGERVFLLLPVVGLVPFGVGAIIAGLAIRFRWPAARWYSAAPFLLTLIAVALVWMRLF